MVAGSSVSRSTNPYILLFGSLGHYLDTCSMCSLRTDFRILMGRKKYPFSANHHKFLALIGLVPVCSCQHFTILDFVAGLFIAEQSSKRGQQN